MNIYYHQITFGFDNAWLLVAPWLFVVTIAISLIAEVQLSWVDDLDTGCRVLRYRRRVASDVVQSLRTLSIIASAVTFGTMLIQESWLGIIQYALNYVVTDAESPKDATPAAIIIVILAVALYIWLLNLANNHGWRLSLVLMVVVDSCILAAHEVYERIHCPQDHYTAPAPKPEETEKPRR